jgi:hypothetical protein
MVPLNGMQGTLVDCQAPSEFYPLIDELRWRQDFGPTHLDMLGRTAGDPVSPPKVVIETRPPAARVVSFSRHGTIAFLSGYPHSARMMA